MQFILCCTSKSVIHFLTMAISCQDKRSALILASLNGHVEVVDKLLQHGACVDWQQVYYKGISTVGAPPSF